MEKLDKVIAGLGMCCDDANGCHGCPYEGSSYCIDLLMVDALELLKELSGKYAAAIEMAAIATERASVRCDGDLISRSALIEEIKRIGGHNLCEWETIGVLAMAERIPAVAVEPIVHAHWKYILVDGFLGRYQCSACEKWQVRKSKRCPECGAHMDEEVADVKE